MNNHTHSPSPYYNPRYIILGSIALVASITLLNGLLNAFAIINPGERGIVIKLGKVQDTSLGEGFHWHLPFITSIKIVNLRIQKTDIQASVRTKDLQKIDAELALNWHIEPTKVNQIYQQIGESDQVVKSIITPVLHEILKAETPKKTAEEILGERTDVKDEIEKSIKQRLTHYGIIIDDVALVNVKVSDALTQAIEAKQIAQQKVKEAEYEALQAAKNAEAEINRAKGQAEAQKLLRQTLTPELLQKQAIEKWNGQFPTVITAQGSLPFINITPSKAGEK